MIPLIEEVETRLCSIDSRRNKGKDAATCTLHQIVGSADRRRKAQIEKREEKEEELHPRVMKN